MFYLTPERCIAGTRVSYDITPFYLPHEKGDVPVTIPAEAGTKAELTRGRVDANILLKDIPRRSIMM